MNRWIKHFYILLTVGGGFLGIGVFVTQLTRPGVNLGGYVILGGLTLLFASGVIAGLYFIEDQRRGLPFVATYMVTQIPIVSSPIASYQVSSGFSLRIAIIGGKFSFYGGIGSDASLWFLGRHPWGVGVNLLALVAVLYAVRVISRQSKTAEPGATDNPDGAQRLREDH